MIVKCPIYCELIGKVDPALLEDVVSELQEQFYFILRKRKIKLTFELDHEIYEFSEAGVEDVRILDKDEALDSLRKKK